MSHCYFFITIRNSSCGKVMFLHLDAGGCLHLPLGRHPHLRHTRPRETATAGTVRILLECILVHMLRLFVAGPSSIALLQKDVLDYLFANLISIRTRTLLRYGAGCYNGILVCRQYVKILSPKNNWIEHQCWIVIHAQSVTRIIYPWSCYQNFRL